MKRSRLTSWGTGHNGKEKTGNPGTETDSCTSRANEHNGYYQMSDRANLGNFLKEVINWGWDEFLRAEHDTKYSPLQATVFALVRSCSDGKLGAIKLSIKRVDGALETPIKVEYPRVFFRYPYAKSIGGEPIPQIGESDETAVAQPTPEEFDEPEAETQEDLLTYGLRETLNKMAETPDRRVVPLILQKKEEIEEALKANKNAQIPKEKVPRVKSVIAANLLDLAMEQNNFEAITEVFDQIDGKLVETFRFLGDDMYMDQYDEVAPAGAILNEDGIYVLEMKDIANTWEQKFKLNKKL